MISFENNHDLKYKPGQYLTLIFPEGATEIRRSYSILSVSGIDEFLSIGVKRKPNGVVSRRLVDDLKTGDRLYTIGAAGMFTLPDNLEIFNKLIFFAAGSGITPIYALIRQAIVKHTGIEIMLVYSNRSPQTTALYNEIVQLQRNHRRLQVAFLFSNAVDIGQSRLSREKLLSILKNEIEDPIEGNLFYICGPEAYMFRVTSVLQEQGIDVGLIRKENFIIPKLPEAIAEPPDKFSRSVDIIFPNSRKRVTVNYPDAILKAARKEGIILPYSCETGRCGNCVAVCIQGGIWHSNNEVLTESDLAKGLILTCTGHPVFEDAIIKIGDS